MFICPICDDTGLQNSDSNNPQFCYCAAGKQARRQWEASSSGNASEKRSGSFIDIANLEQVNASVDAMRASLLGTGAKEATAPAKHPAVQMLLQVAHTGHEVSASEATQLYTMAKALEAFLGDIALGGRTTKR
jgi:hypothetical protein